MSRVRIAVAICIRGGDPPDLIVANPTYIGPPSRALATSRQSSGPGATAGYDGRWVFDVGTPAAIIKTRATGKSAGGSLAEKRRPRQSSATRSWTSPTLPAHAGATSWCSTTCTTGYQLDAVVGCLLDRGQATRVRALVLARASWQ